jgi:hypothetical protein
MTVKRFNAGQNLTCTVLERSLGGFAVNVFPEELAGFVATESELAIGQELDVVYVCEHDGRMLFLRKEDQLKRAARSGSDPDEPSDHYLQVTRDLGPVPPRAQSDEVLPAVLFCSKN